MKVLTWNCNMAFRKKFASIITPDLDLIIIQECEHKEKLEIALKGISYKDLVWYGKNPHKGICIISLNNTRVKLKSDYNSHFEYIIPLELVVNNKHINLFAIWAMPNKKIRTEGYVGQIWKAINYYKNILESESIIIGDLNSNALWDKMRKVGNHTDVVTFLEKFNIESLYHKIKNEDHGSETEPTLFLLKKEHKKYHIDYCFASKSLITKKTTIEIGTYLEWISKSDHMPIWIDNLGN